MDLFKGTAKGYTKYRGEYPQEAIEEIAARLKLDSTGRLLDLGCGDGRLTIPLAKYFKEVVAIDVSPEMINEGEIRAKELGVTNISWVVKDANNLDESIGSFNCVAMAQALHWFNHENVLSLSYKILTNDGAVIIMSGRSIWSDAPTPWEKKVIELIKKYLGPERRTLNGKFNVSQQKSYEVLLKEAGFRRIDTFTYKMPQRVKTVDEVLNEQFTTSYATRELFGNKLDDFIKEFKIELLKIQPNNQFVTVFTGDIIIGFKE